VTLPQISAASQRVEARIGATKVAVVDDIDRVGPRTPLRRTRSDSKLTVPPADRRELIRLSRSPGIAYRIVIRSRIVLELAAGRSNREAAAVLRVSRATVARWRKRYRRGGVVALLRDLPGRGRRRRFSTSVVLAAAAAAARRLRTRGRRVSLRALAREIGISYASLQRRTRSAGGLAIFGPLDRPCDETARNARCTAAGPRLHHERERP
jgi:transposase